MSQKTEAVVIADIFKDTRGLTKFYISKIDPAAAELHHYLDEKRLNSAYWIVAHLTWSQYALQIQSMDGPELDIPWLKHYAIGNDGTLHEGRPSFEELIITMDKVFAHCDVFVRTLTDEQLGSPANAKAIGWEAPKRRILSHSIRHEGTHVGHLSWIYKLNGVKTV